MAGKKQHYIPRALQSGFENNCGHIYKFHRHCTKPITTNVGDAGVQRHFYGPEDCEIDIEITEYENLSRNILDSLRNQRVIDDQNELIRFVYITLTRTKNFRSSMQSLASEVFEGITQAMETIDPVTWIKESILQDPMILADAFREDLISKGYKEDMPQFKALCWKLLYTALINWDKILTTQSKNISEYHLIQTQALKDAAINPHTELSLSAQNRIISASISEDLDVFSMFQTFDWKIIEYKSDLILSDSPVILSDSSGDCGVFFDEMSTISNIIMPFESKAIVFGYKEDSFYSAEEINIMSAQISYEHYISSNPNHQKYMRYFGMKAGIRNARDWASESIAFVNKNKNSNNT